MNGIGSFWAAVLLGWEAFKQRISSKPFQWSAGAIVAFFILLLFTRGAIAFTFLIVAFLLWALVLLDRILSDVDAQMGEAITSEARTRAGRRSEARMKIVQETEAEIDSLRRVIHSSPDAKRRLEAAGAQISAGKRGQLRSIVERERDILAQLAQTDRSLNGTSLLIEEQKERVQRLVDTAGGLTKERIICLRKLISSSEEEIEAEIKEAEAQLKAASGRLKTKTEHLLESLKEELDLYREIKTAIREIDSDLDRIESILFRILLEPRVEEKRLEEGLRAIDEIEGHMEARGILRSLRA